MFQLILVIIQFLILAFVGGFARTTQAFSSSSSELGANILFIFAWVLMNCPFKKLTLHSITIFILAIAFTFQCNLLFGRFWYNIFNGFSTTYELTTQIIIECTAAIFTTALVFIDYIGIFRFWQIYLLVLPIINIFWAFNFTLLKYILKIFDGGCGMSVFLFSGVVSITIWIISVRGKNERFGIHADYPQNSTMKIDIYKRQQSYEGYTISLLGGFIGTFLLWPFFNSSLSLLSFNISTINTGLTKTIFQSASFTNTILALSVGTICSFTFFTRNNIRQHKQKLRQTIDSFMNAGIICASFIDISINPAAAMGMSFLAGLLTLILYWYYRSIQKKVTKGTSVSNFMIIVFYFGRPIFRIILPLLGVAIAAITVATRSISPQLLNTKTYGTTIYSQTAGLQVAGYFVTFFVALLAGGASGLTINIFHSYKQFKEENINKEDSSKVVSSSKVPKTPRKIDENKLKFEQIAQRLHLGSTLNEQIGLNDLDFLQMACDQYEMFPLYLSAQDNYNVEQESALKMLKEVMLSHVKNNYVNSNNYMSLKKVNKVETNRSDTDSDNMKIYRSKTKGYGNDIQVQKRQSQKYKNDPVKQTVVIEESKIRQREPMPEFYVQHFRKSDIKGNEFSLNRSNTQIGKVPELGDKRKNENLIRQSNFIRKESQIKKTSSVTQKDQGYKFGNNEIKNSNMERQKESMVISRKLQYEQMHKSKTQKSKLMDKNYQSSGVMNQQDLSEQNESQVI